MDLLVSYERGRYGRAKREILDVLRRLGDEHAQVERSSVEGIALAHTCSLDAREVARRCRGLADQGYAFRFAIKWVPVDYWCETDLEAIRKVLADRVRDQIAAGETWAMQVAKRRWESQHAHDMVVYLARAIDRKVALAHPDKLVHVDVLGARTAISVLGPDELFSIRRYHPAAIRTAAPHLPTRAWLTSMPRMSRGAHVRRLECARGRKTCPDYLQAAATDLVAACRMARVHDRFRLDPRISRVSRAGAKRFQADISEPNAHVADITV